MKGVLANRITSGVLSDEKPLGLISKSLLIFLSYLEAYNQATNPPNEFPAK